jgi:1,4-alpha-glucan branching enzyme
MAKGYFALVLHAHLPFIHHPEHKSFLEEKWFYEGMTETYIPLAAMLDELESRNIRCRLTMSITPPLAEMIVTSTLRDRYNAHLDMLLELAGREVGKKKGTPFEHAAKHNVERLEMVRSVYRGKWKCDLIAAFRHHMEAGSLEILTCAATHAFLPFIQNRAALNAQLRIAVENYKKHFGRPPKGLWLPECAYYDGMDAAIAAAGIEYFFMDSHGLLFAEPAPRMGMFRPVRTKAGPSAFGRDIESSKSVWSASEGYPGDGVYREFYRDLGYDAPFEDVALFFDPDGVRRDIGLKYHRVTGRVELHLKEPYIPAAAFAKAREHAGNFLFNRKHQVAHIAGAYRNEPVIISPYDAELFGHWWYEGPEFLKSIFEQADGFKDDFEIATTLECLRKAPPVETVDVAASSWGDKGYYEVWLNGTNDWVYRHLHVAEDRMAELAAKFTAPDALQKRALNQAARELVLAEASDWPFIMTNQSTVPYSHNRVKNHLTNFGKLYSMLMAGAVDANLVSELEWKNTIFQEIDFSAYRG